MVGGRGFLLALAFLTNHCTGHLTMNYDIRLLWNGQGINESDVIHFSIGETEGMDGVEININAPFYDDPPPPNAQPGKTRLTVPFSASNAVVCSLPLY